MQDSEGSYLRKWSHPWHSTKSRPRPRIRSMLPQVYCMPPSASPHGQITIPKRSFPSSIYFVYTALCQPSSRLSWSSPYWVPCCCGSLQVPVRMLEMTTPSAKSSDHEIGQRAIVRHGLESLENPLERHPHGEVFLNQSSLPQDNCLLE